MGAESDYASFRIAIVPLLHLAMPLFPSRDAFHCRLCWRITMSVFVLILVIESILLIPSAQRFESVEIAREAERIRLTLEPALMLSAGLNGEGPLARDLATLLAQNRLEALAVYAADGRTLASVGPRAAMLATFPSAPALVVGSMPHARVQADERLHTQWRSGSAGEPTVSALSNISHIRGDLYAYLLRVAGLIFLIVLVVTVGTMWVLYGQLLRPFLAIRGSAEAAGAAPRVAEKFRLSHQREDELGDLITAHNALLSQVSTSMARESSLALEREHFVSRHDALTGLPNRVALLEYLARTEESAYRGGQIGLFLMQFQDDSLAEHTLPTRIRDALVQIAGPRDFVAQLGPLMFALIKNRGRYDSARVAESILHWAPSTQGKGVAEPFDVRIGIVESPIEILDGHVFLSHAEFALRRALTNSVGGYQFFDASAASDAHARQALTRELARALAEDELTVWYQPKIGLQQGDGLAGAEALVRWAHPTRGMVSPGEFIPLAEASGQIEAVDRWVLRAVCSQIALWRSQYGTSPKIAVNLSASHFASPTLCEELRAMVAAAKIFPTDLEIEITETAAMVNSDATIETLKQLRQAGFQTAIDDFGTGYSSLAYLQRFAVDTLKIDRSFVEAIGANTQGETICSAVLKLGHALGTRVVAEGIETAAQGTFLRDLGCDEAQGYWFGKPIPAADFSAKWLAKNKIEAPNPP